MMMMMSMLMMMMIMIMIFIFDDLCIVFRFPDIRFYGKKNANKTSYGEKETESYVDTAIKSTYRHNAQVKG